MTAIARVLENVRLDSWINLANGFGTTSDKTTRGFFGTVNPIADPELAALFQGSAFAARVVNALPREALREGFMLEDKDRERATLRVKWLEQRWNVTPTILQTWIWARLFGGCVDWFGYLDSSASMTPLQESSKKIAFIKDIDRRFLVPFRFYAQGPKAGQVETYHLFAVEGRQSLLGEIHESRLVRWPGALTERQAKISLNTWDYSFLQQPYEALRANGNVWKAIELLVNDANQAVFKIKRFWEMLAGKEGEALKTRIAAMDLVRSVARAMILDADGESFERQSTTFSGLAELDQQALKRLAGEADIPLMIFMGESPSGLNATGDPTIRAWLSKVRSERTQVCEPRLKEIVRRLLSDPECPYPLQAGEEVSIKWPDLWEPTAKEAAEIRKLEHDTAAIAIDKEIVLPEEAALSLYGGENPFIQIDLQLREAIIAAEKKALSGEGVKQPVPLTPTAYEKITKVNEGRASAGLGPWPVAEEGEMTIYAFGLMFETDPLDPAAEPVPPKLTPAGAPATPPPPGGEPPQPPPPPGEKPPEGEDDDTEEDEDDEDPEA
jgi:phage-related protein (TIGR01555 family)